MPRVGPRVRVNQKLTLYCGRSR